MTISDVLMLVAILVAVFTIISEEHREYIIYKFSYTEIVLLFIIFLFVNYLIYYDWFRDKQLFFNLFERKSWPQPETWGYIISLLSLLYITCKIKCGKFSLSRKKSLIKYYEKLLRNGDFLFLAQLIEEYHLKHIYDYFKLVDEIIDSCEFEVFTFRREEFDKKLSIAIKGNKSEYGMEIYHKIIYKERFVHNTANIKPYFFADIFNELHKYDIEKFKVINFGFTKHYLRVLFEKQNQELLEEIRNVSYHEIEYIKNMPILNSLYGDLKIQKEQFGFSPIEDITLNEMFEEALKERSRLRNSAKPQFERIKWDYNVTYGIAFADIVARRFISRNQIMEKNARYYTELAVAIIKNMPDLLSHNSDINKESVNFHLLKAMFQNMVFWKRLLIDHKSDKNIITVFTYTKDFLSLVHNTKKLTKLDKQELLMLFIDDLFYTKYDEKNKEFLDKIMEASIKYTISRLEGLKDFEDRIVSYWYYYENNHRIEKENKEWAEMFETRVMYKFRLNKTSRDLDTIPSDSPTTSITSQTLTGWHYSSNKE